MILVENRKARAEYEILDKYQGGLVLSGAEVKSLRLKSASLQGSFVKFLGRELFLVNAQITPYKFAPQEDVDPRRSRKLLLKKNELIHLQEATAQKGRTLVPLSFELAHNKIKLNFAVARGKKIYERKAELKKRDLDREVKKDVKATYFS